MRKNGRTAESVKDGLEKLARKELHPDALQARLFEFQTNEGGAEKGQFVGVLGRTVTVKTWGPDRPNSETRVLELSEETFHELVGRLKEWDVGSLPSDHLRPVGHATMDVWILGRGWTTREGGIGSPPTVPLIPPADRVRPEVIVETFRDLQKKVFETGRPESK